MLSKGVTFNFFGKADTHFRELHNILDSLCSKLHAEGVGAIKWSAAVITMEDEKLLWEASIISFESPQTLQNIFYYVGLHFCFCSVQEQHELTVQICLILIHMMTVLIINTLNWYPRTISTVLRISIWKIKQPKFMLWLAQLSVWLKCLIFISASYLRIQNHIIYDRWKVVQLMIQSHDSSSQRAVLLRRLY